MSEPEARPILAYGARQARVEQFVVEVLGVPNPYSTEFYKDGNCVAHPDEFNPAKNEQAYIASIACHGCVVQNNCLANTLVKPITHVDTGLRGFSNETGQTHVTEDTYVRVEVDGFFGGLIKHNRSIIRKMLCDPNTSDDDVLSRIYTMRQNRYQRAMKYVRSMNGLAGNMFTPDFDSETESQAS